MRLLRDDVVEKPPQRVEGRVGQADAAVRPEHGDALGQIVERLALHAHRRGVAAFEIHLLGQVLEHPGDAALGLRVGDDADRAAIGQVPPVHLRIRPSGRRASRFSFQRRHSGCSAILPSLRSRSISSALSGALARKPWSRSHSFWKAWLKKRSFSSLVEDRDGRGQLVERVGVAAHRALIFGADGLDLALVDGDARRALAAGEIGDREDAAVAVDHRRQRLVENRLRQMLPGDRLARLGAEQFLAVAHGGIRRRTPRRPRHRRGSPISAGRRFARIQNGMLSASIRPSMVSWSTDEPLVFELQPRLHALRSRKATGSAR